MRWLNKIFKTTKKVNRLKSEVFERDMSIRSLKLEIARLNNLLSVHNNIREFTLEPVWNDQDRKAFGELFQSDLGIKLDNFMCSKAQEKDYQSTLSSDVVRSSGYACGFRDAWFLVKSLSVGSAPQVADEYEIARPVEQSTNKNRKKGVA